RALERRAQPVAVLVLQVALDALGAQLAAIERKFLPGLEAHHLLILHLQLKAALLAAEAAVRLDDAVGLADGEPSSGRLVARVRPELFAERVEGGRQPRHQSRSGLKRAPCASASDLRRQGGQTSW